jgi:decaprenylphospho-beta-D-ribofuranose 2-oxidase
MQPVTGWGRTPRVDAELVVLDPAELGSMFAAPPRRGLLARGLGRSYGDAAQNAGGRVLTTQRLDREPSFVDATSGVVRVGAGVSFDALLRWSVPRGWFVPVTPGTRQVTVGGAIAADVHGKNHHTDGSLGNFVRRITMHTPAGGRGEVFPGDDLFVITLGGMGLTGVVLDADIALRPITSSAMRVDTYREPNLDALLHRLRELDRSHTYTVAWVDLLASGAACGRGVITAGEHADVSELDGGRRATPFAYSPRPLVGVPDLVPNGLLNPVVARAFNELWYRKSPRHRTGELETIASFFYPLDALDNWNRLYGRRGFTQYQFVVPDDATAVLETILGLTAQRRLPGFLGVLKRFGPAGVGLLSFPAPGWTLTMDLPAEPDVAPALDHFDELVRDAGGRVYLAKDARLPRRHLRAMYPNLDHWRVLRDRCDPRGILTSDLDRRLDLTGHHS